MPDMPLRRGTNDSNVQRTLRLPTRKKTKPVDPNASLPFDKSISPKKMRKHCLKYESLKGITASTESETIVSASLYKSANYGLITFTTSESTTIIEGNLFLETPLLGKEQVGGRTSILKLTLRENAIAKSLGHVIPTMSQQGHFGIRQQPLDESATQGPPCQSWNYNPPIPFDNLVVLANKISSRRRRRLPNTTTKTWYIDAVWESMKRLDGIHGRRPDGKVAAPLDDSPSNVDGFVEGIMELFGPSMIKFHHTVLRLQQKSDRIMSLQSSKKEETRQVIAQQDKETDQAIKSAEQMARETEKNELEILRLQEQLKKMQKGKLGHD